MPVSYCKRPSAIGFGSVQAYYEDNTTVLSDMVPMNECRKEVFVPGQKCYQQEIARHACACRK